MALPTEHDLQALASNITNFSVVYILVWRTLAPPLLKLFSKDKHDTGQQRKVFFDVVAGLQDRIEELETELANEKLLKAELLRQLDRYQQD